MIRTHLLALAVAVALLLAAPRAHAALDVFLQIPDAPGESTDVGPAGNHRDWNEAFAYTESVSTKSFTVTIPLSRSYPKLLPFATSGQVFKAWTLHMARAGGDRSLFLSIVFEGVRISTLTLGGNAKSAEAIPTVQVLFTCERATWSYTQRNAAGGVAGVVSSTVEFRGTVASPSVPFPAIR